MGVIKQLDQQTINAIAAGEVVERPASVVKELVENSIDAGASVIEIEIKNGGISFLRIADNGIGMTPEDAQMALMSHATSKLSEIADLSHLETMGFRGEALASIAAVTKLSLETRFSCSGEGTHIEVEGGVIVSTTPSYVNEGTVITIRDLFYNVPARYKFLKSDSAETTAIVDMTVKLALAHPDISLRLKKQNDPHFMVFAPGDGNLLNTIHAVLGKKEASAMLPLALQDGAIQISGYVGLPDAGRKNRSKQYFIVNRRVVSSAFLSKALQEGAATWFMKGNFPVAVICLELPPDLLDVNVHPQKSEVRFFADHKIYSLVYHAVKKAFAGAAGISEAKLSSKPVEISHAQPDLSGRENRPVHGTQMLTFGFKDIKLSDDNADFEEKRPTAKNEDLFSATEHFFGQSEDVATELNFEATAQFKPENKKKAAEFAEFDSQQTQRSNETEGLEAAETSNESENQFAAQAFEALVSPNMVVSENAATYDISSAKGESKQKPIADLDTCNTQNAYIAAVFAAEYIGQLFQTYLIFQGPECAFIIDQHAAHERIIYEKLLHDFTKNAVLPKQFLLVPEKLELNPSDFQIFSNNQQVFQQMGFEAEVFGAHTVIVRAVPAASYEREFSDKLFLDPEKAFLALIDHIKDCGEQQTMERNTEFLHNVACKAAIKANSKLHAADAYALVKQLQTLENPYHCPHGRPLVIKISKKQLEKLFGRIV